jgi:transcriptional regulator with PAS, ATPase and Fis domain
VRALVAERRRGVPDAPGEVSPEVMELIGAYPWPGNVRELRNVLDRALLLARGVPAVLPRHLPAEVRGAGDELLMPHVSRTLAEVERAHIDRTLRAHGANRTRAARELGISRATLIKKIRDYELGERPSAASRRENAGGV